VTVNARTGTSGSLVLTLGEPDPSHTDSDGHDHAERERCQEGEDLILAEIQKAADEEEQTPHHLGAALNPSVPRSTSHHQLLLRA
jgi:hypothetical protein